LKSVGLNTAPEEGCTRTSFLLGPRRDDHDIGLSRLFVRTGPYSRCAPSTIGRVAQIAHLCVQELFLWVHHKDLGTYGVLDQRVGECRADVAGADDGNGCLEVTFCHGGVVWWC
jgi:hypothetical protein